MQNSQTSQVLKIDNQETHLTITLKFQLYVCSAFGPL